MSIKLMNLAWDIQMSPTMKLVLLALCDWANDSGFCFPSIQTLANKACISKRQCQRIMSELISMALIAIVANRQGGIGSRRYQINVTALSESGQGSGGDKLSPVDKASPGPVTTKRNLGDIDVIRTIRNHHSEPPLPSKTSSALDWTYLSKFGESERVVVANMLKELDSALHQEILDELAGALRARAIKTQWPSWLRGVAQRARGGAFVPNHALAIRSDRQRRMREAEEAEKRRLEIEQLNDPEVRAKSREAIAAIRAKLKSK